MAVMTAIGLMSGTSMDGIDLALIETDGDAVVRMGASASLDYGETERALLRRALVDARGMTDRRARPGALAEAERLVTDSHARLVRSFLEQNSLAPSAVDVLGFHGQTVLHRPAQRLTVQIGDGAALARTTGIAVVSDLRAADVAAGGQGAPFVPAYHRALVRAGALPDPVAVLNLGGVGNITYVERDGEPLAFDTGPANALIDDLMLERTGRAVDLDGRVAASGIVDETVLAQMMDHAYFGLRPPKSLDRNDFSRDAVAGLATADAAATLTAFTAASVAAARRWLPREPASWVVCGGGAQNPAILAALAARVAGRVTTADAVGWSASMMEAQAFAYLAVRALEGLPLSFPSTTGVPEPMPGGIVSRPGEQQPGQVPLPTPRGRD